MTEAELEQLHPGSLLITREDCDATPLDDSSTIKKRHYESGQMFMLLCLLRRCDRNSQRSSWVAYMVSNGYVFVAEVFWIERACEVVA